MRKQSFPRLTNAATISVGCIVSLILAVAGCGFIDGGIDDGIEFLPVAESQPVAIDDFSSLRFTDAAGELRSLPEMFDSDYLVLVITRGFNGSICLYCSSQTSKWARRFDELRDYDAELAVVFPTLDPPDQHRRGDLEQKILDGPVANDTIPYPIAIDFDLRSVDELGLRAELARPATYIVDRSGKVRYAYVGQSIADRPSVDAVLQQLARLRQSDRGGAS